MNYPGCIFAEMINGSPLFTGTTEESQLDVIFRHLGTPTEANFPGISELPEWKADFRVYPQPENLDYLVPNLDPAGCSLLQAMLIFDPSKRINAQEARHHKYFDDLPESIKKVGNDMS